MAVSFPSASADLFDFVFPGNSGTRASSTSPASPLPIPRNRSARVWALRLPKTGTVPVTAATPGTPAANRTGEFRINRFGPINALRSAHPAGNIAAGIAGRGPTYQWFVPDYLGRPVVYSNQTFRKRVYFMHPGYREYMKRVLRIALEDLHADLIHFD